jgi:hypothetical protein
MDLIRGSTDACLAHFGEAAFDGDKREALASFCDVKADPTVRRWLSKASPVKPAGAPLIKVRYYLEHLGYQVTELRSLPEPIRDLGRLIAFGVVTFEDVMEAIDIPKTKSGSQLYTILHGDQGVSDDRMRKITAFVKEYRQYLSEALAKAPKLNYLNGGVMRRDTTPRPASQLPAGAPRQAEKTELAAAAVAHAITSLHALLRLAETHLNLEGREQVRRIAGNRVVFETSNMLQGLCSETAFNLQHKRNPSNVEQSSRSR